MLRVFYHPRRGYEKGHELQGGATTPVWRRPGGKLIDPSWVFSSKLRENTRKQTVLREVVGVIANLFRYYARRLGSLKGDPVLPFDSVLQLLRVAMCAPFCRDKVADRRSGAFQDVHFNLAFPRSAATGVARHKTA